MDEHSTNMPGYDNPRTLSVQTVRQWVKKNSFLVGYYTCPLLKPCTMHTRTLIASAALLCGCTSCYLLSL